MPGWRLGYVIAHEDFMKVFNRVKQYTNLNPPTPANMRDYYISGSIRRGI